MLKIMKNKDVNLLTLSTLLSSIGTGISSVGVTWLMINRENGDKIFGIVSLLITILLFFITPYIGSVIDKYSRKNIFLFNQLAGFIVVSLIILRGVLQGEYDMYALVILSLISNISYAFFFPTVLAFVQEKFHENQFKEINSLLETVSQTAVLASGSLASILMTKVSYTFIFLIDAFSFLAAFLLFAFITYEKTLTNRKSRSSGFFLSIREGFDFLKNKKWLTLLFLCSWMPFLIVMVANYVNPIFIKDVLKADANAYALSGLIASLGAIVAGISYYYISSKLGENWSLIIYVTTFTVALLLTFVFPSLYIFLTINLIRGWGHGGAKITRKNLMMITIPNNIIGRVNSFYTCVGLFVRILLIGIFTLFIHDIGPRYLYFVMFLVMVISSVLVYISINKINFDKEKQKQGVS
ncbi:MFS transporter [Bacillus cytotoxicus]|uniref:MFS transporter n=1 Tax=Bacillus cereus group TaxID=86661 RepID=UPI001F59A223|nr:MULTISPECIES: MFS transporter [Bacillus cereus group]MDH2882654.1 MFS transporter [Bacillus cytotoxicus]